MVKLIYNGVMGVCKYRDRQFDQIVERGKEYQVPKELVEDFLKSGNWKELTKKKPIKEEVSQIKEEVSDTKIKKTNGGNKKW